MRYLRLLPVFFLLASLAGFSQAPSTAPNTHEALPKLQHLSADQVNPQVDPCTDFYQYTCSKFFAANPIPPDRASWGVIGPLSKWNEITLRQLMEDNAAKKTGRTPVEQKVGDYWASCMDESKIESSTPSALKTELERIDKMTDKSQLAQTLAHLQMIFPGAWDGQDAATFTPMFGFGSNPDLDDATKIIAAFDQGGFVLPGRGLRYNTRRLIVPAPENTALTRD